MDSKKIYVAHSTKIDFENEVYAPVRKALGDKFNLIFPHENGKQGEFSLPIIKRCKGFVAFINKTSEGRALEVGWATAFGVPTILISKIGETYSKSYNFLISERGVDFVEYSDTEELVTKLKGAFED